MKIENFDKERKELNDKITYLQSKIAIARTHLESHPDQSDHDVRYALGALEIDDPKWRLRIYDADIVETQKNLIDALYAAIDEIEKKMADCSCEKWKSCARHATGKCRICDGETYYDEKETQDKKS